MTGIDLIRRGFPANLGAAPGIRAGPAQPLLKSRMALPRVVQEECACSFSESEVRNALLDRAIIGIDRVIFQQFTR